MRFRIDNFEYMEGPVKVRIMTLPPAPGAYGELVYEGWIDAEEFVASLNAKQEFPVSVRAHRYPMDIGRVLSKETGKMTEPLDWDTWDWEGQVRGTVMCSRRGFCVHEDRSQGRSICPRSIDLPAGLVKHGKSTWVLREDGPPVEEENLAEKRKEEAAFEGRLNEHLTQVAKDHSKLAPASAVAPRVVPEDLGIKRVMGGSGPVDEIPEPQPAPAHTVE